MLFSPICRSLPRPASPNYPQAEHLLKTGTRPADLAKAMRRDRLGLRESPAYADHLTLCDRGVVLGKGTVIARPRGFGRGR